MLNYRLQLPEEFSPFLLSDRSRLEPVLSSADYHISEYSFTNLYMWRNYYKLRWAIIDDIFFLVADTNSNISNKFYAFPPICQNESDWKTALQNLRTWSQTNGLPLSINRVPDGVVEKINNVPHNDENLQNRIHTQIQIHPDRDNWDYVYLHTDLSDLPGKTYANFRKTMNFFKKANHWHYEPIVPAIRSQILQLQTEWCDIHACEESESLSQEDQAIHEILTQWDTLNLLGGTLFVEDRIVAFTIAEKLNPTTIVIHVEKADPSFRGVYECLVQELSSLLPENITFINREQDLGEISLRQAKERYHPHHMVQKSIIEI